MSRTGPVIERLEVGLLGTNCYILKSGEEVAVIDPGGDGPAILERLAELGGTVRFIINTHGHIDHIAANADLVNATGAELLIHELDATMLAAPDQNLSLLMGAGFKSPKAGRFVEEGDTVEVGTERLSVVHTPGHTPGGICLLATGYAFTGDTLFVDSIGRVDFPGGDERLMRESLGRLQALLTKETMLYPGHNLPGTFARALLVNPFLGRYWPA